MEEPLDVGNSVSLYSMQNGLTKSDWKIPPSRIDEDLEKIKDKIEVEEENFDMINYILAPVIKKMNELWKKMPRNIIDKVKDVSKVMMIDAIDAINTIETENITKSSEYETLTTIPTT